MSFSGTLDVAIGVSVVILFLSLAASTCAELIEALLRKRAKTLEEGIKRLVGEELANAIYRHPLVEGLSRGASASEPNRQPRMPSYIPRGIFARALTSVLVNRAPTGAAPTVGTAISSLPSTSALKTALAALSPDSTKGVEALLGGIEAWYDASMDRVSGWYKRHAQLVLLVVGLLFGVALNVDLISVTRAVAESSALRENLVAASKTLPSPAPAASMAGVESSIDRLASLSVPLGWVSDDDKDPRIVPHGLGGWALKVLGLLLTALAVSLGAPFWFDVLNKLSVVRSTVKPGEKAGPDATKA